MNEQLHCYYSHIPSLVLFFCSLFAAADNDASFFTIGLNSGPAADFGAVIN